jgi:hypothetical protein
MMVPDAVVIYRILGLDTYAILALIRVVVTLIIIYYTLRIPFKRTYHWMFLAVEIAMLWLALGQGIDNNFSTPAEALAYGQSLLTADWGFTRVQVVLIFQFVAYFVSRQLRLWEKIVLCSSDTWTLSSRCGYRTWSTLPSSMHLPKRLCME